MRNGTLILMALVLLGGCGMRLPGSLNAGASRTAASAVPAAPVFDPVLPLRQAQLERGLRGSILRVEAVAPTQGWYGAELVALDPGPVPGVLAYEFRATPPEGAQAIGRERARLLTAAAFLPNPQLRGLRQIRVNGTALAVSPSS